jgi:hypothetical protein
MKRLRAYLIGLVFGAAGLASAASVPLLQGPQDVSQFQATVNGVIQNVNTNVPGFATLPPGTRNYLDNAAMAITQRGTGAATGATTAGCVALSYSADRWCADTNVTSGAGRSQVITASPSPPVNFQKSVKVWRNSGALLQPIELMQEIETARATQLAGKPVIASCYVQPLATFSGAAITMNLITGTGTDEGLGALRSAVGMTASPAITPALTGVASAAFTAGTGSPGWAIGTTAVWSRIYSGPLIVPAGATEAVFAIGFVPVGTASGATDGFAVTGCQLEVADPAQVTPTAFEFLPPALDLARAQRFYYSVTETNGGYVCPGIASATNVQTITCQLPQPMQNLPILAVTAGGFSYRDNGSALAISALVISSASIANNTVLTMTDAATQTVGHTAPLYGTNTTGLMTFSADF